MENQKKNYAKGVFVNEKQTKNGNSFMEISFSVDQFVEWLLQNKNDKGYVRVTLWKKKDGMDTKYGTHSVELNTWTPTTAKQAESANTFSSSSDSEDLPF